MSRWHLEWNAGGNGCLPESVEVYRSEGEAVAAYTEHLEDWANGEGQALIGVVVESGAFINRCDDPRCDWCREAGQAVMPSTYAVLADDEVVAFPVCEACRADENAMREVMWDYKDDHTMAVKEIELALHTRKEECCICETLVALDPVGVDSGVVVYPGNRFEFVEEAPL